MFVGLFCLLLLAVADESRSHSFLPFCSPNNLRLTDLSKGIWYMEVDGTFSLSFDHCRLRKFTARDAKRCLQHAHIVFMGDSWTRYLYLSLTSMITTGSWAPKLTHSTDKRYPASIMWEKDFVSWGEFYRVSNNVLNDPSATAYELCDCFREDKPFNFQEKSMVENRHYRQYVDAPRKVTGGGDTMVQLSYVQFYGPMPTRGHACLSLSLPQEQVSYVKYVYEVGSNLCPSSLIPQNHSAYCKVLGREYKYPLMKVLSSQDALWPITPYCSKHIKEARLKNDFPGFWDDITGRFDDQVLKRLEPSHLVVSIGWHAPLVSQGKDEDKDKEWLRRRIESAKHNFAVSPNHRLKLPQVTWRGNSAFSSFGEYNDRIAFAVHQETAAVVAVEAARAESNENSSGKTTGYIDASVARVEAVQKNASDLSGLGFVALWQLTADLWAIQDWVLQYRSHPFDAARFYHYNATATDSNTVATGSVLFEDKQLQAALGLKFRLSPELVRSVLHANRGTGKPSAVLIKLITIFLDHAHPQPYVYNELNNAFLNSVCHV